ncbi:hypothetical protein Agub_g5208 [Astrephomene gubernaculifera]|uniref:Ammonium transporter AmtB-like domain-containing protein n=1 Tax=Astrephomene gubernaculifera TaxID=47775 RepID=A0AAD3DNX5_9CHLO|nr:hypothetical protein Agub_g5208 [Astrephomene gubernaculifera]
MADGNGLVAAYSDLLILHGAIVFFLQVGFVSLEVGYGRSKNVKNILLKNTINILLCAIVWWSVGYAFANGNSAGGFVGTSGFFHDGGINVSTRNWFYSWTFCLSTVTIVSGCLAERTALVSYPAVTLLMAAWLHPVAAHWAWHRNSWLTGLGSGEGCRFLDFAGGTAVHVCGGLVGLVGAALVGPRIGRFEEGRPKDMPGHDVSSVAIGTLFLWFGWFGFNCGSTYIYQGSLAASSAATSSLPPSLEDATLSLPPSYDSSASSYSASTASSAYLSSPSDRVALNMTLTASVSGLAALLLSSLRSGTVDLCVCCNALLAGLVMATPACGFITSWAAVVYGLVAAAIYLGGARLLLRWQIDDPLDSSAIHFGCGSMGTLLLGLLARPAYVAQLTGSSCGGLFYGDGRKGGILLGLQALGVVSVAAWTGCLSLAVFWVLRRSGRLRVDQVTELAGLDNMEHGGPAYPEFNMVPYNTGSTER